MAVSHSTPSSIALILVAATVFSLIGTSLAAEAPAPSPASPAGSITPSFAVGFAITFVAYLFGSALKI